jgi:secretion/DNA translocation related TadE-like protein
VGAIGAIVAVLVLLLQLGSAVSARHRAEAAADLGALAAAAYALDGPESACGRAGVVATRMGGLLAECRLDGWAAVVEVTVDGPGSLAGLGRATGRARAEPVPAA